MKGKDFLWILVFSLFYASSFPPYALYPLSIASLLVLFHLSKDGDFAKGFLAGSLGSFFLLYWLIDALVKYGEIDPVSSFSLILLLSSYMGLYFGVFSSFFPYLDGKIFSFLSIPCFLVTLEFFRGHFLTGFPWGDFGLTLGGSLSLLQLASLGGVYGCTFFLAFISYLLYRFFSNKKIPLLILALSVFAGGYIFGYLRLKKELHCKNSILISLCQPNIDQGVKWDSAYINQTFSIIGELANEARGSDLMLFPETTVPGPMDNPFFRDMFEKETLGKALFIGTGALYKDHNSFFLFPGNFTWSMHYDKVHLVPFGEFLPFSHKFPLLRKLSVAGSFEKGEGLKVFKVKGCSFGVLICFESIFPELSRRYSEMGAHFLVNITNDGWFGDSPGPYQHFLFLRFRAVENGMWAARVANTGISAFISPYGEVPKKLELGKRGILKMRLPCTPVDTTYKSYGYLFPIASSILLIFYLSLFTLSRF